MNSNVLAFSEPRETSHLTVNLKVCNEVDNNCDESAFTGIIGQSSGLRNVLQLVEMVADTDATVLLLGETGTGKELIARAIHERSQRQKQSFVTLNCAAIPSSLFESELSAMSEALSPVRTYNEPGGLSWPIMGRCSWTK